MKAEELDAIREKFDWGKENLERASDNLEDQDVLGLLDEVKKWQGLADGILRERNGWMKAYASIKQDLEQVQGERDDYSLMHLEAAGKSATYFKERDELKQENERLQKDRNDWKAKAEKENADANYWCRTWKTTEQERNELDQENERLRQDLKKILSMYQVPDADEIPVEMLYEVRLRITQALEAEPNETRA